MWQPDPSWTRLPGAGPTTSGMWSGTERGTRVVVKRLDAPQPHVGPEVDLEYHPTYWCREALVATTGIVEATPGLRAAPLVRVEEDAHGLTLVHRHVEAESLPGLFLARALGRFATAPVPDVPWLVRNLFESRVVAVERRGGWTTLARTPVADLADPLWRRRTHLLDRLAALPRVLQHGDPVPGNLLGRDGDDVVAVDWSTVGTGPVGTDLGYLSLSVREDDEPLLDAYLDGLGDSDDERLSGVSREDVALAAHVVAVFTVFTRADLALARAARGEGALAGKFRHPSVAPYLRSMQAQLPRVETLIT